MTQDGAVDARPRTVRVRTEVAAWPRRSTTPCRRGGATTCRSGRGCARPSTGAACAGWVVDDDVRGRPTGVDVLPLKSWLGWGPPPGRGGAGGVGRLALGRAGVVLPADRVADDRRARAAAGAAARRPAPSDAGARRDALGRHATWRSSAWRRPGLDRGAPAARHRPDRPRAVRGRRRRRAGPGRQRAGARARRRAGPSG